MEGLLETVRDLLQGRELHFAMAAGAGLLGMLIVTLAYRLRARRPATRKREPTRRALSRAEVEAIYESGAHLESEPPAPAEAASELSEIFPPELSRRLDRLEEKLRGLALRARP